MMSLNQMYLYLLLFSCLILYVQVSAQTTELNFNGIRPYSQSEQIRIEVNNTNNAEYLWNFNDTLVRQTSSNIITHKFGLPGKYWVTVTAVNATNPQTHSFALDVEVAIDGVELRCLSKTSSESSIDYTLKRGTNASVIWQTDNGEVTSTAVSVNEPVHYTCGSIVFTGYSRDLYDVKPVDSLTMNSKEYVLLFPGYWILDAGELYSWELVTSSSASRVIKLMIYRPTCTSDNLLLPGCIVGGSATPFSTCGSTTCNNSPKNCSSSLRFCYFNRSQPHCREPSSSCSWYEEYNDGSVPRHAGDVPSYNLVHERTITTSANGLYQILLNDGIQVESNDVIGIGFDDANPLLTQDESNILTQLPIICLKSNLSIWRQSVMLFDLDGNRNLNASKWLDSVWCDLRAHYATASSGSISFNIPSSSTYDTFNVSVSNQVSTRSLQCNSFSLNDIVVSLVEPSPFVINGASFIYVANNTPTTFVVTGHVGDDVTPVVTTSTVEEEIQNCAIEVNCSDDYTCSKQVSAVLNASLCNDVTITARTTVSSSTKTFQVLTEEPVDRIEVVPDMSRLLMGTYQEFSVNASGSDLITKWIIDGLDQFQLQQSNCRIMYRTTNTYHLQVIASNHVSSMNASATYNVEEINKFKNLQISSDDPGITLKNMSLIATVEADVNMELTLTWFVDNKEVQSRYFAQPQSQTSTDDQVTVEDVLYRTFLSSGSKTIKVVVSNDYDDIETEKVLEVLPELTDVERVVVELPVVNESTQFQFQSVPSCSSCTYNIAWGDGVTTISARSTVTHTYSSIGEYNIDVLVGNDVSNASSSFVIQVYEKITGFSVTTDSPTEVGVATNFSFNVATGNDVSFNVTLGNSDSLNNVTAQELIYVYNQPGVYTATIVAANPVSDATATANVTVFVVEVVSIDYSSNCVETNKHASLSAALPVDRYEWFNFEWEFENVASSFEVIGNNTIDHIFSSPGDFGGNVTVQSLKTSKTATKEFSICVQDAISAILVTSGNGSSVVESGMPYIFDFSVIGGTAVYVVADFGDLTTQRYNQSDHEVHHVYSKGGNYTAIFTARNEVSMKNFTINAVIQDRVTVSGITTDSEYDLSIASGQAVVYTVLYNGTDVTFEWDFGDGTYFQNGENATHTYYGTDNRELTLTAKNQINQVDFTVQVDVYEPVQGTSIVASKDIGLVDDVITFNASQSTVNALCYKWKVTPSANESWIENCTSSHLAYQFTSPGLYNVTLKAENKASAETSTTEIVITYGLRNIQVIAFGDVAQVVPLNEPVQFDVRQDDGETIASTTFNLTRFLDFDWEIFMNGTLKYQANDTSTVSYIFVQYGTYELRVNVSNTVSTKQTAVSVIVVERITNVALVKLEEPSNAALTGSNVQFQANKVNGSNITYTWKAYSGFPPHISAHDTFSHTYDREGEYNVSVELNNGLEPIVVNLILHVQDKIEGLTILHEGSVVPFYVGHNVNTLFEVDVSSGTDILFTWEFTAYVGDRNLSTDLKNTTSYSYGWTFTKVGTYQLKLNASNLVSWESLNKTVYVIEPVAGLALNLSDKIIPTNTSVTIYASVEEGDDVMFNVDVGDGSPVVSGHGTPFLFNTSHYYTRVGSFLVTVEAYNNATRTNISDTLIVRDVITGLDVNLPAEYLSSETAYNLTVSFETGSDVECTWLATFSDNSTDTNFGCFWVIQFPVGDATISVTADNDIDRSVKNVSVKVQDPPDFTVDIPNRKQAFINYSVIIEINVLSGSDLHYDIEFGDGNTVNNSTATSFSNRYMDSGLFLIKVTAFNKVAQTHKTVSLIVSKLICDAPKLSFIGNDALQAKFYRSRKIYLESSIETFGCRAYTVQYRWRIYQQNSCDVLDDLNEVTVQFTSSPLLFIPPLTINTGQYCVTNTASYQDTPLSSTIKMTVEVVPSPLVVVIAGGTLRYLSRSGPIELASKSYDPDLAINKQTSLTYHWNCSSNATNHNIDDCFGNAAKEQFTIPPDSLEVGYKYNFTLTASKPGKDPVTTYQSVMVVSDDIPSITVTCVSCREQSTSKISTAYQLVLNGSYEISSGSTCVALCRATYFWEAERRNASGGDWEEFPLNRIRTTTGNNGRYLVLRAIAVQSFYLYKFKLTVSVNGVSGTSELLLSANNPPQGGSCSITYPGSHVDVLETQVSFQCTGWLDDNDISPLIYSIIANRYRGDKQIDDFMIYKGTSPTYQAYLPLGFEDNGYNIVIQVLVEDELGTYTLALNETVKVELDPTVSTIDWLKEKTSGELTELLKSSNLQRVTDYAAGLITVLNQKSETQNSQEYDEEFESRVEIRSNITWSVTSLNTKTFDEIQQVAAIFKQCLKVPSEFQNTTLHNVSLAKLNELTGLMPQNIDVTSQSTFLTVTIDLIGVVDYMIEAINYHVHYTGSSILDEAYRKDMIDVLMDSASQLTDNVLEGQVEGEEPVFLNASTFSAIGGRTTPANMNNTIFNNGCFMELPGSTLAHLPQNEEMFYNFFVSEQNPYTFGYQTTGFLPNGIINITSRVPTLKFKHPNRTEISVENISASSSETDADSPQSIKLVMTRSDQQYVAANSLIGFNSSSYNPRDGVEFTNISLKSLFSAAITINNSNTNQDVAVQIMIVFERAGHISGRVEANPYLDVFFGYSPKPNAQENEQHLRLTEEIVSSSADHRYYTIYMDPKYNLNTRPNYYLNITNRFEHHDLLVGVSIFYTACQFFDTVTSSWSSAGLSTSDESVPSAYVCYSDHLTSFGSFGINAPNLVDITEIVNVNFSQNPVALITVVVIFALYILIAVRCYQLDQRDIKNSSVVPLCGPILPYNYEITVKTSPGIGSGTSANIGVCVYGYESRTGARHLYKEGAFQRGSVDIFRIASDSSLGTIYKLKIWHDNTGLDPGWNVSRVMVKDLQTNAKYYFLLDCWLQVYPDDSDETCLQKTIRAASDEEMSDFSLRFGTQLSYGWEDAHLWISLLERPTRSSFTRFQRATCCVTLLYMFMLFSAMWYQNEVTEDTINFFQWKDIAVGVVVSLMVFPINLIIVFLFKKSRCKVSPKMPWDNRAQTAQTVEILDEVLDGRSRKATSSHLDFKDHDLGFDLNSIYSSRKIPSEDTGISTWSSPSSQDTQLRRRSTGLYKDDLDDFWDPFISDGSIKEEDTNVRQTNLRRTQKTKFSGSVLNGNLTTVDDFEDELMSSSDEESVVSSVDEPESPTPDTNKKIDREWLLQRCFMYTAYVMCFCGTAASIFFIILYGHVFGAEVAKRWLVSLVIALLQSILIIEPIKVVFLAIYIAMFTEQYTPEQHDNIVEEPLVETYENVVMSSKIRPPGGFALEQCKDQARKSERSQKLIVRFFIFLVFFWSVVGFCMWDRDVFSYWSSTSIKDALNNQQWGELDNIKTYADVWSWMNGPFQSNIVNSTFSQDNPNAFNHLLGQIRLRQQRALPETCSTSSYVTSLNQSCISSTTLSQDTLMYYPGWKRVYEGNNALWVHYPPILHGIGYWGANWIYDDSGYSFHLDEGTFSGAVGELEGNGWIDRFSRVVFVEFTHINPATHWFTSSVVMFEIESTGVVRPYYNSITMRMFNPSNAFFLDVFFITMIGIIGIVLWIHDIASARRAKKKTNKITFHWLNLSIDVVCTLLCALFIYKLVYLENLIQSYKSNRSGFTNFYGLAVLSISVTCFSSALFILLIIKVASSFKFLKIFSLIGVSLSKSTSSIAAALAMLLILQVAYSSLGYLVFGLNSTQMISDFKDFQNSFYSMFRLINGSCDMSSCFDAFPYFSILFFMTYYFGVFIIFCRLFAVIVIEAYKKARSSSYLYKYNPDHEIMSYIFNRIKMRLGIIKPKQYRPTVHFEGMSNHSSESSFISLDSFGTCFTPGRMSQCSDASGISSSDSGLGTPSNHSLSLFDYLTLEQPPFEKAMDDLHVDYLCDRLSSYSVDMLLRRFDRVNKISDDVLQLESKLLQLTQKKGKKKFLENQAIGIAGALSSLPEQETGPKKHKEEQKNNDTKRSDPAVSSDNKPKRSSSHQAPFRSSSYIDQLKFTTPAHATADVTKRRPRSDEGTRAFPSKNTATSAQIITKKTAW